jgi:predicted short-subunit dehydrogenase-like oxidoreductase (DUF2520 family)
MLREMNSTAKRKIRIAIVGAGNLGSALGVALHAAGFRISEVVPRETAPSKRRAQKLAKRIHGRVVTLKKAVLDADVVWLCVPDRQIAACARQLAKTRLSWNDTIVLHSSGALGSEELDALRKRGAQTGSAHPLMTFVGRGEESLQGVAFAVEGDRKVHAVLRDLVRSIGGSVYPLRRQDKAAYHAWGTFASPLLTSLLVLSEKVAAQAGVGPADARRRMLPIVRRTVENYGRWGAAAGFSGPLIRGDFATVEKHLKVLRAVPAAEEVYRALTRAALRNLPVKNRRMIERALRK